MKKCLFGLLFIFLSCTIIACSNEDASTTENAIEEDDHDHSSEERTLEDTEHEENATDVEAAAESNDIPEENTVESDEGIFTLLKINEDIETLEVGPLTLYISHVGITTGQLKGDFSQHMGTDYIEIIDFDFSIVNNSEETVIFNTDNATLTTSTDEQLEVDLRINEYLDSGSTDEEYAGGERKHGYIMFSLESSLAADVEWVQIHIDAPMDEEKNEIGEDIELRVEF
ncbi:hypothetical protein [Halalkalibacter sp. APA_J-10(15)]|uniref:hypothetical protein n=1 Tax=Halalkalibacter sp. APA_J-10(15) TaxID=2933805 RepID=UPI001FF3C1D0|nr:hypothetical protein [Halalkalibacter sp. APA_J-10(15)]MCK0473770.1 hypothetical protein [Halalkalibacter sp. APA_J-10(15)]